MKLRSGILSAVLAGIASFPLSTAAFAMPLPPAGQSLTGSLTGSGFAGSGSLPGVEGTSAAIAQTASNLASNDPASKLCADGTRAIDQGRWADAVKIFTQVAAQHGDHADGALYWKAYAENKLGQAKLAVNSCAELRGSYPKSRWIDDCGALEVELHAKSGETVHIDPSQSDDVKLLALNAMMRQNEPQALAEIQEILNGDSSEKLKKEAQFILGNHYSDTTYAQVVRISYVEGDVRVQRGKPNGKPGGAVWEKAVADLPVETGFSVATGNGRAEIEFENASTIYLGENSVLTFNDLHETAGVPFTELGLLSGAVSLNFHPYTPREKMVLHTPTNDFVSRYPDKSYARIVAYTDALTITPLEGGDVRLPGVPKDKLAAGRTWTWQQSQLVNADGTADQGAYSAWDKWVADRVAQRNAAVASVLAASGLTAPIPGMADMAGAGKFFDCAPYGTCWEPKDAAAEDEKGAVEQPRRQLNQHPGLVLAAYRPFAQPGFAAQAAPDPQADPSDLAWHFPCTPLSLLYRSTKDSFPMVQFEPYNWAVCHAGSWVRLPHKKHYVWVAGGKRRHADPVRWVKSGHQVGFVPLHPYDVKGRPAINAEHEHEFFAVSGKSQIIVQPAKFYPGRTIQFLKSPPSEFATAAMRPLTALGAPRMEAHAFLVTVPSKSTVATTTGIPIHFDPRTQSFVTERQETVAGKVTTVLSPISNHNGSLQARASSFSGGSGFRGSSAGSSSSGSHGGGGGVSSGGGPHSSGSTTSASSSSAASSASGSHH
jgi:FecR protein